MGGIAHMMTVDTSMLINTFPMVSWTLLLYVNLKYIVPEIFYLLEISRPQLQASTQALDASVFREKCPSVIGVFPAEKKDK